MVAQGCKPLITTLYPENDPYINDDVVFGTKASLVKTLKPNKGGKGLLVTHDFSIVKDLDYADLDPFGYVPKGSASNFPDAAEVERGTAKVSVPEFASPFTRQRLQGTSSDLISDSPYLCTHHVDT